MTRRPSLAVAVVFVRFGRGHFSWFEVNAQVCFAMARADDVDIRSPLHIRAAMTGDCRSHSSAEVADAPIMLPAMLLAWSSVWLDSTWLAGSTSYWSFFKSTVWKGGSHIPVEFSILEYNYWTKVGAQKWSNILWASTVSLVSWFCWFQHNDLILSIAKI